MVGYELKLMMLTPAVGTLVAVLLEVGGGVARQVSGTRGKVLYRTYHIQCYMEHITSIFGLRAGKGCEAR